MQSRNKIILVTGGNKGIGKAFIQKLLQQAPEFSIIVLTSRNTDLGLQAVSQIQQSIPSNTQILYHQLDILDSSSITTFKSWVSQTFGQFDVLMNNAGLKTPQFSKQQAELVLKTNFYSQIQLTQSLLPLIKPTGHIIYVGSRLGQVNKLQGEELKQKILDTNLERQELIQLADDFVVSVQDGSWESKGWPKNTYIVSKNLAHAYNRVLARQLLEKGSSVRVNVVHPGWIRTDMGGVNADHDAEYGARCLVMLAKMEEYKSGRFWFEMEEGDW